MSENIFAFGFLVGGGIILFRALTEPPAPSHKKRAIRDGGMSKHIANKTADLTGPGDKPHILQREQSLPFNLSHKGSRKQTGKLMKDLEELYLQWETKRQKLLEKVFKHRNKILTHPSTANKNLVGAFTDLTNHKQYNKGIKPYSGYVHHGDETYAEALSRKGY